MKLIWLTDIHLNFLSKAGRMIFYQRVKEADGDIILISGDIAEALDVSDILTEMKNIIQKPIYFVLGNHDYYHGEVRALRHEMAKITDSCQLLNWLPSSGIHDLGNRTVLLGEDTWADGRYGDYINSRVSLNDSRMIVDLFQSNILGKYQLLEKMQELADKDALALENTLKQAIENYRPEKIIILIHVPPYKEACLYEGKISNDEYLPFFSSKCTGDVLTRVAQENKNIEFLVLCGHSHGKAVWNPHRNLTVKTGAAEYTNPEIQEVIYF